MAASRWEEKSERDKLIWQLAHTAHALNDAIRAAIEIEDEEFAVQHLRNAAEVGRELLR